MAPYNEKDWWKLASNLPCSDSPADTATRWKMFRNMDGNGNGLLSPHEVQTCLVAALGVGGGGEKTAIEEQVKVAFDHAKGLSGSRNAISNDLVDFNEFNQLVADLKRFFYDQFIAATQSAGDGRMDIKQFSRFVIRLAVWGVDITDPKEAYTSIDALRKPDWQNTGALDWSEIVTWVRHVKKDFDLVQIVADGGDPSGLYNDGLAIAADGSLALVQEDGAGANTGWTADLDLASLIAMLPCTIGSRDSQSRSMMWNSFDVNGNGGLNLSEVQAGLTRLLRATGQQLSLLLSPAITRAFHAAKDANGRTDATFVTRGEEFRLLLVYLKRYFELVVAFDRIDTSDDRKIDVDEFERALPLLSSWGIQMGSAHDEFRQIDTDRGGKVAFDEFAGWAIRKDLDLDPTDNVAAEDSLKKHHKSSAMVAEQASKETAARMQALEERDNGPLAGGGDITQGLDVAALVAKLPTRDQGADVEKRRVLFASADSSNNGTLTLSEVVQGLNTLLGKEAVRAINTAITSAFHAAKDANGRSEDVERVSRDEFHTLVVYLRLYLELLVSFNRIDTSDDRKIEASEFAAALPLLESWGVVISNPAREFRTLDVSGDGKVLFHEYASWALHKGLNIWHGRSSKGVVMLPSIHKEGLAKKHASLSQQPSPKRGRLRPSHPSPRRSFLSSLDLTAGISALIHTLPASKTLSHREARTELFDHFDARGDGALFVIDVDAGLRALLDSVSRPVTHAPVPVIELAFKKAVQFKPPRDRYLSRSNFRLFLCNLKWYDSQASVQAGMRARLPPIAAPKPDLEIEMFRTRIADYTE